MATNWAGVQTDALAAAKNVLAGAWGTVSTGASHQIGLLVQTAAYVEQNKAQMSQAEYQNLVDTQKAALQNVLLGYQAIGIALAQNAVAAVMNVILGAVPGLLGI